MLRFFHVLQVFIYLLGKIRGKYAWSAGLNCDFNCIINSYTVLYLIVH